MTDFTELVGVAREAMGRISEQTHRAGEFVEELTAIRDLIDECVRLDTPKGKHLVKLDDEIGMWTVAHPMSCRQTGLFDCPASGAMLYRPKDSGVSSEADMFLCDLVQPEKGQSRWRLSIVEEASGADQRPSA